MIVSHGFLRVRRSTIAFVRAPGLSLVLVLTIAVGVGSNAAVFGFLEGLIRPASMLRGTDRIVSILAQDRSGDAGPLSPDEYQHIKGTVGVFEWVGAARITQGDDAIAGQPGIATIASVTPDVGAAFGLPLSDGVVISHHIWENEFGGKEKVAGAPIRVDGADLRIDGVAPEKVEGIYSDQNVDVWVRAKKEDVEDAGDRRNLWVLARLRDGVSAGEAQTALRSLSAGLRDVSVVDFTGLAPKMQRGLTRIGAFLGFSAVAVFFIAGINVASFLLGRALRRTHETSLRIALGATRGELLKDLIADSVVISVAGGVAGLFVGILTARALPGLLFEEDAARLSFAPRISPVFIAALVCVVVTVGCGMLPVVGTVTDRPWMVLQRETGSPSRAILRLRSGLVVGQIATCCVLVICTAMLLDGLHASLKTGAGHRLGNPVLLTVEAQISRAGPEVDIKYFSEVEKSANSMAGLSSLAWMSRVPGNQPAWRSLRVQQQASQFREVGMDIGWLTPDSVRSVASRRIDGRMFGIHDQRYRVAVVNEEAAAEIFGRETAGMVIQDRENHPIEIIGVVRDAGEAGTSEQGNPKDAGEKRRPIIFYGYVESGAPTTVRDARFRVPAVAPADGVELNATVVSADYFRALDMALISGKSFSEGPIVGQGRVAVINQEAADLYFNGNPLSAAVIDESGLRTEIIGVVRSQVLGSFQQHADPTIYFPLWQDCPPRMTLMLKDSKWNGRIAGDLKRTVENVPGRSSRPIAIDTLDEQLARSGLAPLRIATLIGGTSAVIGLLLNILGLLSAQGDAERQRQRDRALRMALGAQRWRIVLLAMRTAGRLAMLGAAIGVLLSFAIVRILIADVAIVSSPSLQVWLIAPLFPIAAVMIASMVPARRASAIAPATIMRDM